MKMTIAILTVLLLAGCSTNSIQQVDDACTKGHIEKFRERKDNDELMFSCFEADAPEDVVL